MSAMSAPVVVRDFGLDARIADGGCAARHRFLRGETGRRIPIVTTDELTHGRQQRIRQLVEGRHDDPRRIV